MKKKAIICIDDEQIILTSLKSMLKDHYGDIFQYEFAESAAEGLEIIEEMNEAEIPIVIVISDWLMQGMKGDEFLLKVHEKHPGIAKILLTGQAADEAIERIRSQGDIFRHLEKPWNEFDFFKAIDDFTKN